jgi:predicted PurR-regulated permease PerM
MSNGSNNPAYDKTMVNSMVESALRIGLIFFLLAWAFNIIRPFIIPIVWGGIIAIALMPIMLKLKQALGGRQKTAAAIITLLCITVLIVPTVIISDSLLETGQTVSIAIEKGEIDVPPPPAEVAEWPVIGEPTHQFWSLASRNLGAALKKVEPQLKQVGGWLIGRIGGGIVGVLMFLVSLLIAGAFLGASESVIAGLKKLASRVAGVKGPELVDMSASTVRSVVQGVLGIAVIQAVLAAIGMFSIGVPAAALWTLLVLLLAVVQLPPLLILGPAVVYVFSYADTTPAVIFAVWSLFVSVSDSFLKPLLLGRGLDIPMLVILIGAIGGMLLNGIIGLFVGAVVLAVVYKLFGEWLNTERA